LRLERDELKGALATKKLGTWLLEAAAARLKPTAEPDTPKDLLVGGAGQ
jgi:hypothetical protein